MDLVSKKQDCSGYAKEPALQWAHVPLFVPALAVFACTAVAISALALFNSSDVAPVHEVSDAPVFKVYFAALSPTTTSPVFANTTALEINKSASMRTAMMPTVTTPAPVLPSAAATITATAAFVRDKMSGTKGHGQALPNIFPNFIVPVSLEMPAEVTTETAALFAVKKNALRNDVLPAPIKPIEMDAVASAPVRATTPARNAITTNRKILENPVMAAIQLPQLQLPLPKPSGVAPFKAALYSGADGRIGSVEALDAHFERIDYDLANVRDLGNNVPRLYIKQLPADIADIVSVKTRKRVFIKAILPVVLRVNEDILAARDRLVELHGILDSGMSLNDNQRKWLYAIADRYEADPYDWDALMARVDIIPPSLAIAQAAEESGWGTSRFAREGNALFGQYTFAAGNGMLPEERASGRQHRIRSYSSLVEGVRSYMHNLNYHRAYGEFRNARKWLRDRSKPIDGDTLAGELLRYSERGAKYVKTLRTIMRANDLAPLDDAQLHKDRWTQDELSDTEQKS